MFNGDGALMSSSGQVNRHLGTEYMTDGAALGAREACFYIYTNNNPYKHGTEAYVASVNAGADNVTEECRQICVDRALGLTDWLTAGATMAVGVAAIAGEILRCDLALLDLDFDLDVDAADMARWILNGPPLPDINTIVAQCFDAGVDFVAGIAGLVVTGGIFAMKTQPDLVADFFAVTDKLEEANANGQLLTIAITVGEEGLALDKLKTGNDYDLSPANVEDWITYAACTVGIEALTLKGAGKAAKAVKKIKDWVIGKRADNRVFDSLAWDNLDDLARLDNATVTRLDDLPDGTQVTRIEYPDGSDILRVEQHVAPDGRVIKIVEVRTNPDGNTITTTSEPGVAPDSFQVTTEHGVDGARTVETWDGSSGRLTHADVNGHEYGFVAEAEGPWILDPDALVKPYFDEHGRFTNGRYVIDAEGMIKHKEGDLSSGSSQFGFAVDAETLVLEGALYADANGLWVAANNSAKVPTDAVIGALGHSGEPTSWLNVYRTNTGFVHGSPGNPP